MQISKRAHAEIEKLLMDGDYILDNAIKARADQMRKKYIIDIDRVTHTPTAVVKMVIEDDAISHPAHYRAGDVYEAIKVIEAWSLGFNLGNTLKYICRLDKKPGVSRLQNLKKARWYIDREIQNCEKEAQ